MGAKRVHAPCQPRRSGHIDAPKMIGNSVSQNIELHTLTPEVATKVSQARSHSFFIKDGNNAVVLVIFCRREAIPRG